MANLRQTAASNRTYGLVSVLYHALQEAARCDQYMEEARKAGDSELVQFFVHSQEQHRDLAGYARRLLTQRLHPESKPSSVRPTAEGYDSTLVKAPINAGVRSGGSKEDDTVDEASMESFPASDSPAY